jgi:hypothetical protein
VDTKFELFKGQPNWTPEQQKIVQDVLNSVYRNVTNGICVAGVDIKAWFCQQARNDINDLMYEYEIYPSDVKVAKNDRKTN